MRKSNPSRILSGLFLAMFCLTAVQSVSFSATLKTADLRCEYLSNPLGIDVLQPRLSWIMLSLKRADYQTAYQILTASSEDLLMPEKADLWNSGKIDTDQSIHVRYQGMALHSGMRCYWKVRIWDKDGEPSEWSETAIWSMGLLDPKEWKARWIGKDEYDKIYHLTETEWIWFPEKDPAREVPVGTRYFRRNFKLPELKKIKTANFYITGDNELELFINGKRVIKKDDYSVVAELFVDSMLLPGENMIAASVVNTGQKPNPAGLTGKLVIIFRDGSEITVKTDSTWKSANREEPGWQKNDFADKSWIYARVTGPVGMLPWGEMYGFSDRRLPARWLRKEFAIDKNVARSTLYVCGLGLSEVYLNGKKVSDHVLSPALSEYPKRMYYVTHDVTSMLSGKDNAIGVVLGNGRFFAPRAKTPTATGNYGYPKLLLRLHIEFNDGSSTDIVSDETWKITADGPIIANNEFDGEEYDARMELAGWSETGYDDMIWQKARIVDEPGGVLSAQMTQPIRVTGILKPVTVSEAKPGIYIFDMGQNMVGWCRIRVNGPRGTKITLRHAETLKSDGTLYTENLRSAKATDLYVLKGEGVEIFEPRFTYHGFRFVEIEGYPGKPDLSSIEGCVVNDDVESAGGFICSDPTINRTYKNIIWGVRGNYRSIPTDCPQRDERQGWLGDRSSESKGETYIFDIAALYSKWMMDIADAQKENGSISDVCPSYWPLYNDNVTWPSSAVIIPGGLLEQYADSALIRRQYPAMVKWINHMSGYIGDSIITRDSYGDWCVPPEDPKLIHTNDPARKTNPGILSTGYFIYDLNLMARYARLLNKPEDASRFSALADTLEERLNFRYYDKDKGYYDNGTQTSCVLPLAFGIVPQGEEKRVFNHLEKKISAETNYHIGTGLIGGQFLNRVLTEFGRSDIVYRLATNITYPSWGYMAEKGATTIWELWNGDSGDPGMNSGNHVMLVGDLVIWLYEHLAGIRPEPARPGFKNIVMRPIPQEDLTFVKAEHKSPYGLISSHWKRENNQFMWDIIIPANARATIYIPSVEKGAVTESGMDAAASSGLKFVGWEKGYSLFEAGSGKYSLRSQIPPGWKY